MIDRLNRTCTTSRIGHLEGKTAITRTVPEIVDAVVAVFEQIKEIGGEAETIGDVRGSKGRAIKVERAATGQRCDAHRFRIRLGIGDTKRQNRDRFSGRNRPIETATPLIDERLGHHRHRIVNGCNCDRDHDHSIGPAGSIIDRE